MLDENIIIGGYIIGHIISVITVIAYDTARGEEPTGNEVLLLMGIMLFWPIVIVLFYLVSIFQSIGIFVGQKFKKGKMPYDS